MQLRPGKFRVKENSRANYADVLEIDHDAQVMVVGDVTRYFDRVRRNVNKAVMRNVLKKALEQYRQGKLVGKKGAKLEASEDDDEPEGESDPDHPDVFLMPDETASVIEKRQPESPLISSSSAAAAAAEMPPPPPPAPPLPPMDMPMPTPMPIPIQQPSPPRDDAASIRSHASRERRHSRKEAHSPPQDDTASIRSHASRERRHSRKEAPPPPRGEDLPRKMSDQHVDGASRPYRQRIDLPRSRSHRLPEPETGSMYDVATARAD
ncbi:hypothetical protein CH063_04898 [Colletotrichum higginsianum]|uniref:Uncharacterized protein n=1 Tax=Colletotrichum higginsianum (strain IMI 349063) TaxID=759273 RepID=H1UX21_COLHI|nr:hypothetical protein CH063_04898 [Colletotrichum higginsianum]